MTVGYIVYVGLDKDPRTNHILNTDYSLSLKEIQFHHVLISTASGSMGEWQFATGTPLKILKR